MSNLKIMDVDGIGQCCLRSFEKLPKTGKPIENEWTVFSCILQYDNVSDKLEVVSLGTGSKCIGATKMSPTGDVLNDSHAEVIARRGFLLYLYDNISKSLENKDSIFVKENGRFKLKNNIEFVFYSSQLPCGDASIFPKSEEEHYGHILQSNKRKAEEDIFETDAKRPINDIHRTGAKCLPQNEQDCKESGTQYHLLGQVRTKPGRGDRTLSVSCSDKMAKWIQMGIQGRLLGMLLVEPIYISKFVFGGGVPYSKESSTRALLKRNTERTMTTKFVPELHQTTIIFPCIKSELRVRPAAGSIVWTKAMEGLVEVAVQGRKQGLTKKKARTLSSSLCISKYNLYRTFQELCKKEELQKIIGNNILDVPYNKMKAKATRYEENWQLVKNIFFKTWTIKPDIWDFCVNAT